MTGKVKDNLIGQGHSPEVDQMQANLDRMERIITCLKRHVERLGGDPNVCEISQAEEDSSQ